jgi:hypothetical protein
VTVATLNRQTVTAARDDVGVFAEALIGQRLWDHQLDLARSEARIRCVCSGRQAGKSTAMAVIALHHAFASPGRSVLIVSAGEEAAKDLIAVVSMLAMSPLLAGSVVDDERHQITLSNGSTIRSVPASERQIRGKSVHLLILDEAAFVDESIWEAAKWTTIARPDSRVVLASTPWGRQDRFFALAYRAGLRGEPGYASFHWPSTASPIVDHELLEVWRGSTTDREYRREVLAEWVDAQGAYFDDDELEAALADYELTPPSEAKRRQGVAGVDWGFARDSSAVVVLSIGTADELAGDWPDRTFTLPWIDEGVGVPYATFVRRVADLTRGYRLSRIASETNGVGAMPTQELKRLARGRAGKIVEVATTADSKEDAFGRLKVMLSQGRLALPRHPRLLSQLSALEFEERDSGTVKIEVPQRAGHDDLCMALMLAAGVGDVASPSPRSNGFLSSSTPTTPATLSDMRLPPMPAVRQPSTPSEPGVPVVGEDGRKPKPRPGETFRHGPFRVPRRGYTPPGSGQR